MSNKQYQKFIDYFKYDFYQNVTAPDKCNNNLEVIIADVHCPFHDKEAINEIMKVRADILWIVGDYWDFYSKSRYPKEKYVDFKVEFRLGFELLDKLLKKFHTINLILANHDSRADKYLYNKIPMELLPMTHCGLLQELLSLKKRVRVRQQRVNCNRLVSHIYQADNMILTHFEKSCADETKALIEISKYLHKWKGMYNLKDYNIIMQAHNHAEANFTRGTEKLIGIPCLIDISQVAFNYVFSGKPTGNPPVKGYVTIEKNGNIYNPESIKVIRL